MNFRFNILPPQRFRKAWYVSIGASILAVVCAIGPNYGGEYNPALAVLTLTLIAVIWYTYFTFQAIHKEEPTLIKIDIEYQGDASFISVHPSVKSLTRRHVLVRPSVEIWIDDHPIPQIDSYTDKNEIPIEPYDGFRGSIPIGNDIMQAIVNPAGEMLSPRERIKIRFSLKWADELGDSGSIGPKHWYANLPKGKLVAVVAPENIERLFQKL